VSSATSAPRVDTASTPTLRTSRGEIRPLTGLRFFAAAWVVLFHLQFTPGAGGLAFFRVLHPVLKMGALGVDLFFVLSGFVIALTYLDRLGPALRPAEVRRFVWARFVRIWPVYAAVTNLFGVWLAAKAIWGTGGKIAFQAVQPSLGVASWLQQMFMVQLWSRPVFDGSSWVGPAWSISAEWLAYLLFPLLAPVFHRFARGRALALGAASVAVLVPPAVWALLTGSMYHPYSWLARILTGFSAGVLVYLAVRNVPWTQTVTRVAAAVSVLASVGVLIGLVATAGPSGDRGKIVVLLFPVLVGALALAGGWPARLLSSRAAVHGGRISYSLYLLHVPILEVVWTAMLRYRVLGHGGPGVALTAAAPVAAVVAAHLMYRVVEEPARTGLGRLTTRRRAVPAAAAAGAPGGTSNR
jgi:peptidoglycan/LPS O-acetylase OafA/YrhL